MKSPLSLELVNKIRAMTLNTFSVQGCILETDAAKSGSNAQNATRGAMKNVQV